MRRELTSLSPPCWHVMELGSGRVRWTEEALLFIAALFYLFFKPRGSRQLCLCAGGADIALRKLGKKEGCREREKGTVVKGQGRMGQCKLHMLSSSTSRMSQPETYNPPRCVACSTDGENGGFRWPDGRVLVSRLLAVCCPTTEAQGTAGLGFSQGGRAAPELCG